MGATVSIPTSNFKDEGDSAYNAERYYDAALYYTLAINHKYSLISNENENEDQNENEDNETTNHNLYDNLEYVNHQLNTKIQLSKLFSNRSSAFLLCNQPI